MKRNKIVIVVALLVVTFFGVRVFAGSLRTPEEKAQHLTQRISNKLALTDEQAEAVYELNIAKVNSRETTYETKDAKKTIHQASKKAWKEGLEKVLTKDQLEKLDLSKNVK